MPQLVSPECKFYVGGRFFLSFFSPESLVPGRAPQHVIADTFGQLTCSDQVE